MITQCSLSIDREFGLLVGDGLLFISLSLAGPPRTEQPSLNSIPEKWRWKGKPTVVITANVRNRQKSDIRETKRRGTTSSTWILRICPCATSVVSIQRRATRFSHFYVSSPKSNLSQRLSMFRLNIFKSNAKTNTFPKFDEPDLHVMSRFPNACESPLS